MRKLKKPIKPMNFTRREEFPIVYGYESSGGGGGGCWYCSTSLSNPGGGGSWNGGCDRVGSGGCGSPTAYSWTPPCGTCGTQAQVTVGNCDQIRTYVSFIYCYPCSLRDNAPEPVCGVNGSRESPHDEGPPQAVIPPVGP